MGQIASAISAQLDNGGEKEAKAKEQLELMMKLADARLDTFEAKLKTMFLDRDSSMKTSVPGRRALRFERHVRVDTQNGTSEGVDTAVDAFFGAGDTGSKGVLEGFKSVVKTGLSAILGDTSAGESYDEKFFVCIKQLRVSSLLSSPLPPIPPPATHGPMLTTHPHPRSNAIIRVDMYTYKYNFANEGVIATHKNILAYILCISVVDHKDVTVDELIYLASEFAGDGPVGANAGFEVYLNSLMKTWNALVQIDPFARIAGGSVPRPTIEFPPLPVRGSVEVTTAA
ncbi:hypothetical protein MMC34_003936 [Xylographa carneopallida]|nr:hypothetical protein [Xylographa carneopallida]